MPSQRGFARAGFHPVADLAIAQVNGRRAAWLIGWPGVPEDLVAEARRVYLSSRDQVWLDTLLFQIIAMTVPQFKQATETFGVKFSGLQRRPPSSRVSLSKSSERRTNSMIDLETFLTTLYVLVDDFCKAHVSVPILPGRPASLTISEVVTLSIFSQWYVFRSQRDFYRWAQRHLRAAFPQLPDRAEYNRLVRKHHAIPVAFAQQVCQQLDAQNRPYEVLDTSGIPVRNVKRRGWGWLAGMANVGWCTRMGWFNGFRLLIAVNPEGVMTGYGFGPGSAKEQPLSDTFIYLRQHPDPRLGSVGKPARGTYLADQGFASRARHARWRAEYGVVMLCEPQTHQPRWPKPLRRWLHGLRQIVETTFEKLFSFFRLDRERPHELSGFQADLAAKVALHNFCIWLNKQLGRPPLAFASLLDW